MKPLGDDYDQRLFRTAKEKVASENSCFAEQAKLEEKCRQTEAKSHHLELELASSKGKVLEAEDRVAMLEQQVSYVTAYTCAFLLACLALFSS